MVDLGVLIRKLDGEYRIWIPYLFWFCMGSSFTIFDEIHIYFGIMDHSNNIVHQLFPPWFSPNYGVGGLLFYFFHSLYFPKKRLSIAGGNEFPLSLLIKQIVLGIFVYLLSGLLCGRGLENTIWPFVCGVSLIIIAGLNSNIFLPPVLWFTIISCSIGVGFEWFMSYQSFGFKHGVCPSLSCLGTNVSMSWLPAIYSVACSFMHRIILGE